MRRKVELALYVFTGLLLLVVVVHIIAKNPIMVFKLVSIFVSYTVIFAVNRKVVKKLLFVSEIMVGIILAAFAGVATSNIAYNVMWGLALGMEFASLQSLIGGAMARLGIH